MEFIKLLNDAKDKQIVSPRQYDLLVEFYETYSQAITKDGRSMSSYEHIVTEYLKQVLLECQNPSPFEPYHQAMRKPYDFYHLGLEFFRPLVQFQSSKIHHPQHIKEIESALDNGDNVILLANHQIEPDPQIISLLLEKEHPKLAEEMIMVAGHRVISDPLAIPFSKGRNLLCIYSKKHIENFPDKKQERLLHNQRTMHKMSELLSQGGKCIYVAPSGGRDRFNEKTGKIDISPFDPASIEMFWLMAQHSGKKTHFFPLTLSTYDILPPPKTVEVELGESRHPNCAPVHLSFGNEINMTNFPGSNPSDKKANRISRALYIWNLVQSHAP